MQVERVIRLTKQAVSFFEEMNKRHYGHSIERSKAEDFHFIANLLLDLVEIAYPLEMNEQDDFKAYKSFVNFLREDNCPRIKIPSYEQWKEWMDEIERAKR